MGKPRLTVIISVRITKITEIVAIGVGLAGVSNSWTVVAGITNIVGLIFVLVLVLVLLSRIWHQPTVVLNRHENKLMMMTPLILVPSNWQMFIIVINIYHS